MIYYSNCEADTLLFGEALGKTAKNGDVFCLTGQLGAGKTVFAKGFAIGLGIIAQIASPTFTLVNEYEGKLPFYHFDAYRLEGAEPACFEFEEYFESGVCLIEWADRITEILPENAMFISIERTSDDGRRITFDERINI